MAGDFLGVAQQVQGDPNAQTRDYLGAQVPVSVEGPASVDVDQAAAGSAASGGAGVAGANTGGASQALGLSDAERQGALEQFITENEGKFDFQELLSQRLLPPDVVRALNTVSARKGLTPAVDAASPGESGSIGVAGDALTNSVEGLSNAQTFTGNTATGIGSRGLAGLAAGLLGIPGPTMTLMGLAAKAAVDQEAAMQSQQNQNPDSPHGPVGPTLGDETTLNAIGLTGRGGPQGNVTTTLNDFGQRTFEDSPPTSPPAPPGITFTAEEGEPGGPGPGTPGTPGEGAPGGGGGNADGAE